MRDELPKLLQAAQDLMFRGVKLSRQSSLGRRAPESAARPHFEQARDILDEALRREPENRTALVSRSQCAECLLDYESALEFLSRTFAAGELKTHKALKRFAAMRESARFWRDLSLSPELLQALGHYLEAADVGPNHRTMQLTRQWLASHDIENPDKVLAAFDQLGAFSDFQVLANVVYA